MNRKAEYKILIINGVNLSQIGTREIDVYGKVSFNDYFKELQERHPEVEFNYYQNDNEQALASNIANACGYDGIILNAGAFSHTSIVLADAIGTTRIPVIETHISNLFGREQYRRESRITSVCRGMICGFGLESYNLATEAIKKIKRN